MTKAKAGRIGECINDIRLAESLLRDSLRRSSSTSVRRELIDATEALSRAMKVLGQTNTRPKMGHGGK
jgi:hypothetical protein